MNKEKLIEVLGIQSYSYDQELMVAYIEEQISQIECSYYFDNDNIYITKGNAKKYPCVVAHMDTVHKVVEDLTVIEINGNLTGFNSVRMEQTGIGGDDKVGIFVALQCLERFDNIKIAFFRDEEVGCQGSYEADIDFFNDCNIVLQCDRKGNKDFVNNASGVILSSKEFQKEIAPILKTFGYALSDGMMTDVMALKELGIKASMANISCGYYNPHSSREYVNIIDVHNCLNMVISIIASIGSRTFNQKYTVSKKWNNYEPVKKYDWESELLKIKSNNSIYDSAFDFDFKPARAKSIFADCCESCGEIAPLEFKQNYQMMICKKCSEWY